MGIIYTSFKDSIKYLQMASFFNTDSKNRMGFHKYFMGKSDRMWTRAKDVMKYVLKRGGHMRAIKNPKIVSDVNHHSELESFALSLDMLKQQAKLARIAYVKALGGAANGKKDVATVNLMAELDESYAEEIKETSAKLNTIIRLWKDNKTNSMALHLFDKTRGLSWLVSYLAELWIVYSYGGIY